MEEPGGLQSMGLWRVGHDWATSLSLFTCMHWRRKWQPTPVFLPGESQGRKRWLNGEKGVATCGYNKRGEEGGPSPTFVHTAAATLPCPPHLHWQSARYRTRCVLRGITIVSQISCMYAYSLALSRLALCNSMDCSPPGSSGHGIFQARRLEWVVIPFSMSSSQARDWTHDSCVSCIGRQILYHRVTWEAL